MNKNTTKMVKAIKILLIVLAFGFSSNVDATTATEGQHSYRYYKWYKWYKYKKYKKYKKHKGGDKIPLDAGLSVLVLGAAAFGAKKLRKKNNE